jgi:hypothetical protein
MNRSLQGLPRLLPILLLYWLGMAAVDPIGLFPWDGAVADGASSSLPLPLCTASLPGRRSGGTNGGKAIVDDSDDDPTPKHGEIATTCALCDWLLAFDPRTCWPSTPIDRDRAAWINPLYLLTKRFRL